MKLFFFSISLILSLCATAQESEDTKTDSTEKSKPQFKLSLNYNSGLNYYGRTDSLKSSGVFPLAEFWITPKFYINAAPIFINNKVQSFEYAGTVTTIGLQNVSKKWITGLYALKPFYKAGSDLVQSALQAQAGVSISRLTKVLNFNVGGDIKFSDKVDFGASAGVDHLIKTENKDGSVIVIDPSFYTYMGTQQFSQTYTKKQANPLLPPVQQQVTETRFNILSYEISMPIVYVKKKWMLLAVPSYVIPQNLITVPNRPDLSETGQNMFYATIGIKYTF
jgi:hypothetical protein